MGGRGSEGRQWIKFYYNVIIVMIDMKTNYFAVKSATVKTVAVPTALLCEPYYTFAILELSSYRTLTPKGGPKCKNQ